MKKVFQLSALLFAIALVVAIAPSAPLPAHANATLITAAYSAQTANPNAQPQNQNPPATNPNDQNPNQNPNNPNAAPPMRARGRRLPKTASPLPEIALIGIFSLLGIIVVRRFARNMV